MAAAASAGRRLKSLLDGRRSDLTTVGSLVLPGCFDGIVARMCARKGFDAVYLSGGGTSAVSGLPDIGIVGVDGFCEKIRNLSAFSGLPVLSDADTGFADSAATVHAYVAAGAAGMHIEDQVFPKRCGHLQGKEIVPGDEFSSNIERCVKAVANSRDPDFIICARTDARGVEGGSVTETVDRLRKYADAGATMLFPEGLRSKEEFFTVARELKKSHGACDTGGPYLLSNMTEFGVSPHLTSKEFGELGYDLTIYPMGLFRIAMRAVESGIDELMEKGSFAEKEHEMLTRNELYSHLNYDPMDMPWGYPNPSASHKK